MDKKEKVLINNNEKIGGAYEQQNTEKNKEKTSGKQEGREDQRKEKKILTLLDII